MITKEQFEQISIVNNQARELAEQHLPKQFDPALIHNYSPMEHVVCGKVGKFEISLDQPKIEWPIITMRNAILSGQKPTNLKCESPTSYHRLTRDGGTLTTDSPNEIYTQCQAFQEAQGNVLVSGLGLGMALGILLGKPGVEYITVVEKEKSIIQLSEPYTNWLRKRYRLQVIHQDIFKYLKTSKGVFNFAYHDIWYGTGESEWVETIVPLYRATRKAGIPNMGGWCERDMQSQLFVSLFTNAMTQSDSTWKPIQIFLDALRRQGIQFPFEDSEMLLVQYIQQYLLDIGSSSWEETFNWDQKRKRT